MVSWRRLAALTPPSAPPLIRESSNCVPSVTQYLQRSSNPKTYNIAIGVDENEHKRIALLTAGELLVLFA